jgi:hypothetical protein
MQIRHQQWLDKSEFSPIQQQVTLPLAVYFLPRLLFWRLISNKYI